MVERRDFGRFCCNGCLKKLNNANSWRTLLLQFNDDPISEVITALERHFGKKIRVTNDLIYNCTINSSFDQDDLDLILNIIDASLDMVNLEKAGDEFILDGTGCPPTN